jgi:hypothetical protein
VVDGTGKKKFQRRSPGFDAGADGADIEEHALRTARGRGCERNEATLGVPGDAMNQDGHSVAQGAEKGWGGFLRPRGSNEFCQVGQFAVVPLHFDARQGSFGGNAFLAIVACMLRFGFGGHGLWLTTSFLIYCVWACCREGRLAMIMGESRVVGPVD